MTELSLIYPARITQEDQGYCVEFLDFEAFSEGDTFEEALLNAREALDVTLLGLIDTDQDIPEPSESRSKNVTSIPASPEVAVPVLLAMLRKRGRKTIAEVANAMDVSLQRYHDIEKGGNITLKTLKRAAAALGATVEVKFSVHSEVAHRCH